MSTVGLYPSVSSLSHTHTHTHTHTTWTSSAAVSGWLVSGLFSPLYLPPWNERDLPATVQYGTACLPLSSCNPLCSSFVHVQLGFSRSNTVHCRSQWPRGPRRRSTATRLLRSWVRIPPRAWMFVCCQVEVSATDWSFIQRSPTDCGASLYVIMKPRKQRG